MALALSAISRLAQRILANGVEAILGLATWNLRTHGCWDSSPTFATGMSVTEVPEMALLVILGSQTGDLVTTAM